MTNWLIFRGSGTQHDDIETLPEPPPWRARKDQDAPAKTYQVDKKLIEMVNAALYLRRPLFVAGKPGSGKSTLAHAVAWELKLGPVLYWPINTRTTLKDGLYHYDAIARLQDASLAEKEGKKAPSIGEYIRLGPLGTAMLPTDRPRVLLIDEIDKSEIDLPNDLLHILERGEFEIPELSRARAPRVDVRVHGSDQRAVLEKGVVHCRQFPFIVMTSNGEREFPAPFFRRCLRVDIEPPDPDRLEAIVEAHLQELSDDARELLRIFCDQRNQDDLAVDQLLNAIFLASHGAGLTDEKRDHKRDLLRQAIFRSLSVL
ncbi:MAG: MoxR family ATPase [Proteobacteria bacterium]|nr:MoxR family ATPase [Pseudomonadota bacterium]